MWLDCHVASAELSIQRPIPWVTRSQLIGGMGEEAGRAAQVGDYTLINTQDSQ